MNTTDLQTTHDPLDLLIAARPTDKALSSTWTPMRSEAALDRIPVLANEGPVRRGPLVDPPRTVRRWAALAAVGAFAAAVLIAGTTLYGPRDALSPAQAYDRTVAAAAHAEVMVTPGKFWHRTMTASNRVEGRTVTTTWETWRAFDGSEYGSMKEDNAPGSNYFAENGIKGSMGDITFIRSLPTEPVALVAALDASVGSPAATPTARAEALTDLLRNGATPATVRAVAIRALRSLPGTTIATERRGDSQVLRMQTLSHYQARENGVVTEEGASRQTTWLDPETSLVLESRWELDGEERSHAVLSEQELRDAVPGSVVKQAVQR